MPFDGKNFQQAKPALTIASLVAWLETQDPAEEYKYCNSARCLLGQWLNTFGLRPIVSSDYPPGINPFVGPFSEIAANKPHTFGAALGRAREILSAS